LPRQIITRRALERASAVQEGSAHLEDEFLLGGAEPHEEAPAGAKTGADSYKDRLLKYIPAEVIAAFLTLSGLLKAAHDPPEWMIWAIFAFGLAATPLYLARLQHVTSKIQLTISAVAFVVWVFATGGPFADLPWYQAPYGSVVLVAYTFFIPLIEP